MIIEIGPRQYFEMVLPIARPLSDHIGRRRHGFQRLSDPFREMRASLWNNDVILDVAVTAQAPLAVRQTHHG
jgi:hypothetical protein